MQRDRRCAECKRPAFPGERLCAHHKENARLRRERYEQRKREASGRTLERRQRRLAGIREQRRAALVEWARERGRVPRLAEIGEVLGLNGSSYRSNYYQGLRRDAFGIRVLNRRETRVVIPFPVPAEFRSEAEHA